MQGEMAKSSGVAPKSAVHIIKQLGLFGLYKGATAWSVEPFFPLARFVMMLFTML